MQLRAVFARVQSFHLASEVLRCLSCKRCLTQSRSPLEHMVQRPAFGVYFSCGQMIDDAKSTFLAYLRAFEKLDPALVLPFYHLPAMFIAPQGIFVLADANTASTLLTQVMQQLRSQSYLRTEVTNLVVRQLSPSLVSCAGVFARIDTNGQEIARLGFTYTMRSNAGSWQIVVALLHELPEA